MFKAFNIRGNCSKQPLLRFFQSEEKLKEETSNDLVQENKSEAFKFF